MKRPKTAVTENPTTTTAVVNDTTSDYEQRGADRLSSLPDTLLCEILSLLQLKPAAITSALSHRWRHLWTHTTNLSFDHLDINPSQNRQKFITTVDQILRQIAAIKIRSFFLCWFANGDELRANPFEYWITQVCARNPDQFTVNFSLYYNDPSIYIPKWLFVTESMVELQLCCENVDYKLPDDGVIKLPNLKKLNIRLSDIHRNLMRVLFQSCPLLEFLELQISYQENDHVIHILAPKLKSLTLCLLSYCSSAGKLITDTPQLEFVRISGNIVWNHIAKSECRATLLMAELLPSVEYNRWEDFRSLLLWICCARSLKIEKSAINLHYAGIYRKNVILPTFHHLMHLKLTGTWPSNSLSMHPLLFSGLKKVDVEDAQSGIELKMLEYILNKGNELERLCVSFSNYERNRKDQLWKEYEFCRDLFMLSRSSSICQIEFSGICISASSNDFRNGSLAAAQIRF